MECDNNRLDGMCHLGVIQLNLVFIIFSFLCDMDVSSSRFQTPKTFDEEKECVQFCSEIYSLQEQIHEHYRFFKNGKTKTRSRFAPLSQVDCLKVKTLVWMCKR